MEKKPMWDNGAEQSVIGALIIDDRVLIDVKAILSPGDFFYGAHQQIYGEALAMHERGETIDIVTLLAACKGMGYDAHISEISLNVPGAANVMGYAGVVADWSRRRAVVQACGQAIEDAQRKRSGDLIADLSGRIEQAGERAIGESLDWNSVLNRMVASIEEATNSDGDGVTGVRTRIPMIDNAIGGLCAERLIVLASRPSVGKAQPLDSNVLLASGEWRQMGNVCVGDALASIDGATSVVDAVFPQGVRPIYRLTLVDGRTVEADANHLWRVSSCKWAESRVIKTTEIQKLLTKTRYQGRMSVPLHSGSFGEGKPLGIDSWLLGFLLGDGCLSKGGVSFSNSEAYIHERIRQVTPGMELRGVDGVNWRIFHRRGVANPLRESLKSIGVIGCRAHEKFVPVDALLMKREERFKLLAGLLESDGWVQQNCVQFSSSSERLARDCQQLVFSLGGSARITCKPYPTYMYNGERCTGRPAHIVSIALGEISEFLQSPRLLANIKPRAHKEKATIASVEYIGEKPAQCISVTHSAHLYLTDDYVVTHNTAMANQIAVNAARDGVPGGICSLEMGEDELGARAMAYHCRANFTRLLRGRNDALTAMVAGMQQGAPKAWPLHLDTSTYSLSGIEARITGWVRKHDIKFAVIDHIGLIELDGDGQSEYDRISIVTRRLKKLAKRLKIAIIAVCQLNRAL
jgi:replicative DNA helicase